MSCNIRCTRSDVTVNVEVVPCNEVCCYWRRYHPARCIVCNNEEQELYSNIVDSKVAIPR